MKTVAIVGSPRKDGNCDILVNKLLEKIDGEKSIYYLNELDIGFCKACQACQKGDCVKMMMQEKSSQKCLKQIYSFSQARFTMVK